MTGDKKSDYFTISISNKNDLKKRLKLFCIKKNISILNYVTSLIEVDIKNDSKE